MFGPTLIEAVENLAESVDCSAHELTLRASSATLAITPHDEAASWCGDLRFSWSGDTVVMTLEHSGPVGQWTFHRTAAGMRELLATLRGELAE